MSSHPFAPSYYQNDIDEAIRNSMPVQPRSLDRVDHACIRPMMLRNHFPEYMQHGNTDSQYYDINDDPRATITPAPSAHTNTNTNTNTSTHASTNTQNEPPQDFRINLNVGEYKPNELKVKVIENCIVVKGSHAENRNGNAYVTRRFVRRYSLPSGCPANRVKATLMANGILSVCAPHVSQLRREHPPADHHIPIPTTEVPQHVRNERANRVQKMRIGQAMAAARRHH